MLKKTAGGHASVSKTDDMSYIQPLFMNACSDWRYLYVYACEYLQMPAVVPGIYCHLDGVGAGFCYYIVLPLEAVEILSGHTQRQTVFATSNEIWLQILKNRPA